MNSNPANPAFVTFWILMAAFAFGLLSCIRLLRSGNPVLVVVAIFAVMLQSAVMFVVLLPAR